MRTIFPIVLMTFLITMCTSCKFQNNTTKSENDSIMMKLNDFAPFTLTADISKLSDNEKKMIPILIDAAKIMDDLFWQEAYGDKNALLNSLKNEELKKLAMINYGPWERLNNNKPFVAGVGAKQPGANFFPADMTVQEFETFNNHDKNGLYSIIRRNDQKQLIVVPYHEAFKEQITKVSDLLEQASELADDPGLKTYLGLRAKAFLTDDYLESDLAWMDMKDNMIDFVVGPIETYEDQLFGYKAAHEAYILVKDKDWSNKLAHFSTLLPTLQKSLPVDPKYKAEVPGSASDLGVYEVIYYAGDCNAGSKTIAINLPNDERVQAQKGSRRLQLKNSMQAKFDKILIPITEELITSEQLKNVTFDAFFSNTMFHEIAHGLGPSKTVNGKGTVREALKEHYTTMEEGKADILGLFLETRLKEMGELDVDLTDEYMTFLAGIFRSIRFGASTAHGKANLMRYNFFRENGAFTIDAYGKYIIDPLKMEQATTSLTTLILTIQGDGDYTKAGELIDRYNVMDETLRATLKRIEEKDIPVDIVFNQGADVLGL
jgi:hypothetical protein